MDYYAEKGLAVCGLACVLCSEECCPGCQTITKRPDCSCSICHCAAARGLEGCYECPDFPCHRDLLTDTRNRAFNRYARQYGRPALLQRLETNHANGINYHHPDGLKGDYDQLSTEAEIIRLIHFGSHDPYLNCPVLETANFLLRLIRPEDADDLLECYSDPRAQALFNTDRCTDRFCCQTLTEMTETIAFWLGEYHRRMYVRFAIISKHSHQAVGTVEIFKIDRPPAGHRSCGLLRLDLATAYETPFYLDELYKQFSSSFYLLFDLGTILTKAAPDAKERLLVLAANHYRPFDWEEPGRDYYWKQERSSHDHTDKPPGPAIPAAETRTAGRT